MNIEKKAIQDAIVDILCAKIYLPAELCAQKYWDLALTGDHFRLSAVDLAYFFFEVEKRYHIHIEEEYLLSYEFNSVNSIAEIIKKYVP